MIKMLSDRVINFTPSFEPERMMSADGEEYFKQAFEEVFEQLCADVRAGLGFEIAS